MKLVVDRIENGYIVAELEDMSFVNIPLAAAPDAKEGDVISIAVESGETEKRRRLARDKMNELFGE